MTGGPPYKAVDVARRMVEISIDKELWLTNLKLQKVLYFTWVDYFAKYRVRLFEDQEFEAWKYGPVVPDVYYDYWLNVANLIFITDHPANPIDSETSDFLEEELRKYTGMSAGHLVDKAHQEGSPWQRSYQEGDKTKIPFSAIEKSVLSSSGI